MDSRGTDQKQPLVLFLGAIVVTTLIVTGGLTLARHRQIDVRAEELSAQAQVNAFAAHQRGALFIRRVSSGTSLEPFASEWDRTPPLRVGVRPQVVTMPILERTSIDTVSVAVLVEGDEIVWRVSWKDPEPDRNVDTGRFCDALALQFPLTANASFMMGAQQQSVQILHWKAIWQQDVDEHFQDVQDLHPNYWTDLYWFAEGEFPYPVPDAFSNQASLAWFPAYQAGNPMSDFHRRQPVEELSAQGYGTLTHQERAETRARGAWQDGQWAVVLRRPLQTDDEWDYQFSPGDHGQVALAVWQGSAENVGGRKHHSEWLDFEVEQW